MVVVIGGSTYRRLWSRNSWFIFFIIHSSTLLYHTFRKRRRTRTKNTQRMTTKEDVCVWSIEYEKTIQGKNESSSEKGTENGQQQRLIILVIQLLYWMEMNGRTHRWLGRGQNVQGMVASRMYRCGTPFHRFLLSTTIRDDPTHTQFHRSILFSRVTTQLNSTHSLSSIPSKDTQIYYVLEWRCGPFWVEIDCSFHLLLYHERD